MNITEYILTMLRLKAWRNRQLRREGKVWRSLMQSGGTVKQQNNERTVEG